jgi:hypothetical protein
MENPTIKIRELKKKDRTFLASIILKFIDKFGSEAIPKISDSAGEKTTDLNKADDQLKKIGVDVIMLLLKTLEEDMTKWFIDLTGCTPEQFENDMPFDVEIQIIQLIMEAKEVSRFFTLPSLLSSKIPGLVERLQGQKRE